MTVQAFCVGNFRLAFLGRDGVGKGVGREPVAYVVGIVLAVQASARRVCVVEGYMGYVVVSG